MVNECRYYIGARVVKQLLRLFIRCQKKNIIITTRSQYTASSWTKRTNQCPCKMQHEHKCTEISHLHWSKIRLPPAARKSESMEMSERENGTKSIEINDKKGLKMEKEDVGIKYIDLTNTIQVQQYSVLRSSSPRITTETIKLSVI